MLGDSFTAQEEKVEKKERKKKDMMSLKDEGSSKTLQQEDFKLLKDPKEQCELAFR